jgi:hypothetical protein
MVGFHGFLLFKYALEAAPKSYIGWAVQKGTVMTILDYQEPT